jgi:hypothetical protein
VAVDGAKAETGWAQPKTHAKKPSQEESTVAANDRKGNAFM